MIEVKSNQQVVAVNEENKTIAVYNSKIKQKILEEEEYLEVLDKIVERDFYPELTKLKLRSTYIDALDSNDVEQLRRIQLELEKSTPCAAATQRKVKETPQEFDAPFEEEEFEDEVPEKKLKKDDGGESKLTLDRFLAKNTSEDNASFEIIMEVTREKHRQKHAWLYKQQQELHERLDASKALPSTIDGHMQAIETKSNNVDTWKYVAKNALMYTPAGVELSAEEVINAKGKKEKQICHENTRFKSDPFDNTASHSALVKASQEQADLKKAVGKIGVDGKLEDSTAGDAPAVRGYQFIGTPSMTPGVGASPLMTWGAIEGTPLRLDATPAPSFKMKEPPRREQLAHSLVEKASKQHREKRKKAMAAAHKSLVSPRYTPKGNSLSSERLSLLSPAAQKLVKSSVLSSVRLNTDSSLRASYSPFPLNAKRTPHASSVSSKTPTVRTKTPATATRKDPASITDDLLQLPKS